MLEDRLVDIEERRRDERMGLLVAQPLGERRQAFDVDQDEHALLAHRLMVAPEQEVVEGAPTDHPAHLQEFEITRKMTNASTVSRSKGRPK